MILGWDKWTCARGYDNHDNTLIMHDRVLFRASYHELGRLSRPYCIHLPLIMSQAKDMLETLGSILTTDTFWHGMQSSQEPDECVEIRNDSTVATQRQS